MSPLKELKLKTFNLKENIKGWRMAQWLREQHLLLLQRTWVQVPAQTVQHRPMALRKLEPSYRRAGPVKSCHQDFWVEVGYLIISLCSSPATSTSPHLKNLGNDGEGSLVRRDISLISSRICDHPPQSS